jgi:gliding motility-associated lipoprotein GldK
MMMSVDIKSYFKSGLLILAVAFVGGCGLFGGGGGGDQGNVVGVPNREGWVMTVPFGMVPIPAGTFHMGQADEDVPATQINYNKQVTISSFFMDQTEITNNEYRQFVHYFTVDGNTSLPGSVSAEAAVETISLDEFMENYYPDTMVFVKDFAHHYGDPLMEYYWWHPAFDDYPVVGVDWKAANFFCSWRTAYLNDYRVNVLNEWPMPTFRLPTEAEWEYASRGGRDMAKYPWGNPYIRNAKGCMLANFKPGRGNYYDDGFAYTARVESYFANDYGLYDMSGNVSEWVLDDFNEASVPTVWDLNPKYIDPKADPRNQGATLYASGNPFDANYNARKVIRGGSWKDVAYFLETGTRTFEFKDSTRAYIGFRCAVSHLGRSSGQEF